MYSIENFKFRWSKPECFRMVKNNIAYPFNHSYLCYWNTLRFRIWAYVPFYLVRTLASVKTLMKSPLNYFICWRYPFIYCGMSYKFHSYVFFSIFSTDGFGANQSFYWHFLMIYLSCEKVSVFVMNLLIISAELNELLNLNAQSSNPYLKILPFNNPFILWSVFSCSKYRIFSIELDKATAVNLTKFK